MDNAMAVKFPRIKLKPGQRAWLRATKAKWDAGEDYTYEQLRAEVRDRLPKDFNPNDIDPLLLDHNGEITLLGLLHADPQTEWATKCHSFFCAMKAYVIEHPDNRMFTVEKLAEIAGLSLPDTQRVVALVLQFMDFLGGPVKREGKSIKEIGLGDAKGKRRNPYFDSYVNYHDIETLLQEHYDSVREARSHGPAYVRLDRQLAGGHSMTTKKQQESYGNWGALSKQVKKACEKEVFEVIRSDLKDVRRYMEVKAWKPAVILCGGILEAMLTDWLSQEKPAGAQRFKRMSLPTMKTPVESTT